MTSYGYATVSTEGQTLDTQLAALQVAGCETIVREKLSSTRADRTELATIKAGDLLMMSPLAEKFVLPSSLPVKPVLDAETERAARAFLQRLEGRYPVQEALLYGSRARGSYTAESDADIAVVMQGKRGDRTAAGRDMAGIAFDVMMETGVLVEALPLWDDEFRHPDSFSNPALIHNIRRDGLRL